MKKKNTKTTNFCCCCDDDDDNTSYAWTQKLTKWLSVFKQLHEVSNHYIRFFPILLVVVLSVFATIEHSKRRQNNNPMMISRAFCLSLSQCVRNETVCYFYIDTQSWNRERTTEELKWAEKKNKNKRKIKTVVSERKRATTKKKSSSSSSITTALQRYFDRSGELALTRKRFGPVCQYYHCFICIVYRKQIFGWGGCAHALHLIAEKTFNSRSWLENVENRIVFIQEIQTAHFPFFFRISYVFVNIIDVCVWHNPIVAMFTNTEENFSIYQI